MGRPSALESEQLVMCPWCDARFDLCDASWCGHPPEGSKACPDCARCLCDHPGFENPRLWVEAPDACRRNGIPKLFVLYR